MTLKYITSILFLHLTDRANVAEEKLLVNALRSIDYDLNRLQYYVENGKIYLQINTPNISKRYYREFLITMVTPDSRWMFTDFKPHIKALLTGNAPILPDLFPDLQETWGISACADLFDILELFEAEPVTTDFNWQVLGATKLSVETTDSLDNFSLPLILLDYLWRLPSEETV